MAESEDEDTIIKSWCTLFKQATDFDTWGQPLEATAIYQNLSKELQQCIKSENSVFDDDKKKVIGKIKVCLDSRSKSLQDRGSKEGISLDDLLKLELTLKGLRQKPSGNFPVDINAANIRAQTCRINALNLNSFNEDEKPSQRVTGNLLPRPIPIAGKSFLTITVEKIGLKDASQYIDPFICISVKDSDGKDLVAIQNTPVAVDKQETCVFYNINVYIQKTLDSLPPGFAVFFEFKHFKPKKKVTSTKCWAFLEKDEIKNGHTYLELYKKPTDSQRKKVYLLTVKPLYLHLKLSIDS